jgi:hypothetical protein
MLGLQYVGMALAHWKKWRPKEATPENRFQAPCKTVFQQPDRRKSSQLGWSVHQRALHGALQHIQEGEI